MICPNPINKSEKKEHFSSFRTYGVVSIDLDSESGGHSESENEDDKQINYKVTSFDDNDECDIDYHLSPSFKIDNADQSTNDDDVFVPTPLKLCKYAGVGHHNESATQSINNNNENNKECNQRTSQKSNSSKEYTKPNMEYILV